MSYFLGFAKFGNLDVHQDLKDQRIYNSYNQHIQNNGSERRISTQVSSLYSTGRLFPGRRPSLARFQIISVRRKSERTFRRVAGHAWKIKCSIRFLPVELMLFTRGLLSWNLEGSAQELLSIGLTEYFAIEIYFVFNFWEERKLQSVIYWFLAVFRGMALTI